MSETDSKEAKVSETDSKEVKLSETDWIEVKLSETDSEEVKTSETVDEKEFNEILKKYIKIDDPPIISEYYARVFPLELMCEWLSYGSGIKFIKREICLTLSNKAILRPNSYKTVSEFRQSLVKSSDAYPVKIDIGAIYNLPPVLSEAYIAAGYDYEPVQKEIVIDVDVDDFKTVRSCCGSQEMCSKCWLFIVVAVQVLERMIVENFGFKHRLWAFSGRRGVHCWIADAHARKGKSVRDIFTQYVSINNVEDRHDYFNKTDALAHGLLDLLPILEKYVVRVIAEQDVLGSEDKIDLFLDEIIGIADKQRRKLNRTLYDLLTGDRRLTSEQCWKTFVDAVKKMNETEPNKYTKFLVEKAMFYIAYPRIDVKVTEDMRHLLKAPFSVHPDTNKVAEPFDPDLIEEFDPFALPHYEEYLSRDLDQWPALNVFKKFVKDMKDARVIKKIRKIYF